MSTCEADTFPEICDVFSLFRLVDVSWEAEGYALDALPICFHMLNHKPILKARK